MHYFDTAFSVNGQRTIVARPQYAQFQNTMGRGSGLSQGDKSGMTQIYGPPKIIAASISSVRVSERPGGSTARLTVTLTKPASAPVTMRWETRDGTAKAGSDYRAASGMLSFPINAISQDITVAILDDDFIEPDETLTVHLSGEQGARLSEFDRDGTITIEDDDRLSLDEPGDFVPYTNDDGPHNLVATTNAPGVTSMQFLARPQITGRVGRIGVPANGSVVVKTIPIRSTQPLNAIYIKATLRHPARDEVLVKLKTPDGFEFPLGLPFAPTIYTLTDYLRGRELVGDWTLTVSDKVVNGNSGTLDDFQIIVNPASAPETLLGTDGDGANANNQWTAGFFSRALKNGNYTFIARAFQGTLALGDATRDGISMSLPAAAPTDISLSNASVPQNQPPATLVGVLNAQGAGIGANTPLFYSLVAGQGDADNASFEIRGDTLVTAKTLPAGKTTYSVRINADNGAGGNFSKAFAIGATPNSSQATLTVAVAPSPAQTNDVLVASASASFPGTLGATPVYSYQWLKNAAAIQGETAASLDLSQAGNGDRGDIVTVAVKAEIKDGNAPASVSKTSDAVAIVNSAPTLANASFEATQNVSFSRQLIATDADGDGLTYGIVGGTLPVGLRLSASGDIAGTPTQNGSFVATIEVSDGREGAKTAQITIVVSGDAIPPTLSPTLAPVSPKTNDTLTVTPNGDAASYAYVWRKNGAVIAGETGATLNLSKPGNGDKNDVITVEVTGTGASGGTATVTTEGVKIVNSLPIAISSQGEVPHDTEKGFVLRYFDADGDAVTYKRVGGPRNGVTADIRVDPTDGVTKLFYKSRARYGGVDIIRFVVFDSDNKQSNESTLGIRVLYTPPPPPNRAPIAGDTNLDTYVGASEVKGLLGSDPDGDALSFRVVSNAKFGRSEIRRDADGFYKLFYTSLPRYFGADSVLYIVTDSRGKESNLATVNINFINRAPLAQGNRVQVASGAEVSQFLFGTDEDGDELSFRLVNNPRFGKGEVKLDAQGKWRFFYTSSPGYVGPDQITFIAIDPQGKESQVAAIDINVVRVGDSSAGALLAPSTAPSGGGS